MYIHLHNKLSLHAHSIKVSIYRLSQSKGRKSYRLIVDVLRSLIMLLPSSISVPSPHRTETDTAPAHHLSQSEVGMGPGRDPERNHDIPNNTKDMSKEHTAYITLHLFRMYQTCIFHRLLTV